MFRIVDFYVKICRMNGFIFTFKQSAQHPTVAPVSNLCPPRRSRALEKAMSATQTSSARFRRWKWRATAVWCVGLAKLQNEEGKKLNTKLTKFLLFYYTILNYY